MSTCEPWAVAAVYLMQSASGKEHYTDIVSYILKTELTKLNEKSVATSRTLTQMLNQKVINNRAVFINDGNGYYSLDDEDTLRKSLDIQDVIKSLNDNNQNVRLLTRESKDKQPVKEEEILYPEDDKLIDEARKLSVETLKLSDEARKLSDETRRLSDETLKLSDENKKLREETRVLREKYQQLSDDHEELNKEARKLQETNQQLKEKVRSIKQLCE